jgi:hypothetical protein
LLDTAFPEDANVKAALSKAGVAADAGYADGKALLVQCAMDSGMIDPRLIEQQWGGHLPDGITAKAPYGYTVDPRAPGTAFREACCPDAPTTPSHRRLDQSRSRTTTGQYC